MPVLLSTTRALLLSLSWHGDCLLMPLPEALTFLATTDCAFMSPLCCSSAHQPSGATQTHSCSLLTFWLLNRLRLMLG